MPFKKAIFLDRDGVINIDNGYTHTVSDFHFCEEIFTVCQHFQREGFLIIVVTNQSGIARGLYTADDFHTLTEWMVEEFRKRSITISKVYFCPHHPDFGPFDSRRCNCRKPKPGMLNAALIDFQLDPSKCILIGDKESDIEAAQRAEIGTTILIDSKSAVQERNTKADIRCKNLEELTRNDTPINY